MKPENRDKLEQYRGIYNTLIKDDVLILNPQQRADIVAVIREEFAPNYTYQEWCGKCVADMVKFAFKCLDANPVDNINIKL